MLQGIKEGRADAINLVGRKRDGEEFVFAFYDDQLPKLLAELERRAADNSTDFSGADAKVIASAAKRAVSRARNVSVRLRLGVQMAFISDNGRNRVYKFVDGFLGSIPRNSKIKGALEISFDLEAEAIKVCFKSGKSLLRRYTFDDLNEVGLCLPSTHLSVGAACAHQFFEEFERMVTQ